MVGAPRVPGAAGEFGGFGSAAGDYARHRRGFPESFFRRARELGIGGGRVLDVGTGTGSLARGFAARGARALGLDPSRAMLGAARGLSGAEAAAWIAGRAEALPFRAKSFDAVTAGQCWHWFDGPVAAEECWRVLVPGGRVVVAHFDYLVDDGGAAAVTEELVLAYNPGWELAGSDGLYERWRPHLLGAGFGELGSIHWIEQTEWRREDWCGRMRACNGVIALGDPERIAAFDAELAEVLEARFGPGLLSVPHRVFMLVGRKG